MFCQSFVMLLTFKPFPDFAADKKKYMCKVTETSIEQQ